MKKWLWTLILAALCGAGLAEESPLPAGAEFLREDGAALYYRVEETGEELTLVRGEGGEFVSLSGRLHGEAAASGEAQSREGAKAALEAEYPGAFLLRGEEVEIAGAAGQRLFFLHDFAAGWVSVGNDRLLEREISFGSYREEGALTMAGARMAISLYRPEARIVEIERDREDGLWLYEGEALLDRVEYEFELDAESGRLLEWERD